MIEHFGVHGVAPGLLLATALASLPTPAPADGISMAELATAEGLFVNGEIEEAQAHAECARAKLKVGTRAWLRADDIVSYKPPVKH